MMRTACLIQAILLSAIGLAGCNNDPPEPAFATNLGTAEAPLLPVGAPLLSARDPKILTSSQADLVKRGDSESAAAAAAAASAGEGAPAKPLETKIEPAGSFSEALGSIGRTFAKNIVNPPATPEATPPPAAGGTEKEPAAGESKEGGQLTSADMQAIRQLLVRVNDTAKSGKFTGMVDVVAADKKAAAEALYPLMEELVASIHGAANALEKTSPGIKDKVEGKLAAALGEWTMSGFSLDGADAATAQLTVGGGPAVPLRFVREETQWKLDLAFLPAAPEVEAATGALQSAIDGLDELTEKAAASEAGDASAAESKVDAATALVRKYYAGA
jgi:hypothetical protein